MSTTTHACPGRCGVQVARALLSCKPCWRRLPASIRRKIWRTHTDGTTADHIKAVQEALAWYRDNSLPNE